MSTDDQITRKLDDWPYARAYVAETLDRSALERQAAAMLSRAINVGRLIAFVSSGVSMSYGRLAWSGLVSYAVNDVLERYRKLDRPPANMVTISENLSAIWPASDKKPRSVRSDRYPALFQYCERLDKALAELPPLADEPPEPPLRDKVAALLYDDRGHAYVMMSELLADRKDLARPDLLEKLRLELNFTRGKSGRDDQDGKWLSLFSTLHLIALQAAELLTPIVRIASETGRDVRLWASLQVQLMAHPEQKRALRSMLRFKPQQDQAARRIVSRNFPRTSKGSKPPSMRPSRISPRDQR